MKHCWNHVFFEPWIGPQYEDSWFNIRLLLLGESHYGKESEQIPTFTRDLIKRYVTHDWSHKFFTILGQTVFGRPHTEFARADVWEHVCFYNFVQKIVVLPRRTPTDLERRNASLAFFELLNALKPELVICCGWRLHSWLPDTWEIGIDYNCGGKLIHSRFYDCGADYYSEIVPIQHPSSRQFDWSQWHDLFQSAHNNAINRSREAGRL